MECWRGKGYVGPPSQNIGGGGLAPACPSPPPHPHSSYANASKSSNLNFGFDTFRNVVTTPLNVLDIHISRIAFLCVGQLLAEA